MSVSILIGGGLEKPIYKAVSGTSDNDVYTAIAKQERLVSAQIVNTTAGAIVTQLIYTDTATVTDVVFFKRSIPANDTVTVDFPIRLYLGDKIKVNGNTGITVVLAMLNDNGPLGGLFGG